jgi:hypothetical protein
MRLLLLYEVTDKSPVFCYRDCDSGNKIEGRKSVDCTINTLFITLISSASYLSLYADFEKSTRTINPYPVNVENMVST